MINSELRTDRDFRLIMVIILIAAIFCLSIGYASYNTLLQIDNSISINPQKWLVSFDNISTATVVGNAKEKAAPTLNATNISLNVELASPGDSISYTFDVVNGGNIDAKLSALPTISGIPDSIKDSLDISIKYDDGTALAENDVLTNGTSKKMKITIKYNENTEMTTQTVNASVTLLYIQK
jgi:hypothetical protein